MEAKANIRKVRVSPRKVRLVADLIRGRLCSDALGILAMSRKANVSNILSKLVSSAVANAQENMNLDVDRLYIKTLTVDQGTPLKRWLPRMRGKADRILKRTSHISVVLDEKEN